MAGARRRRRNSRASSPPVKWGLDRRPIAGSRRSCTRPRVIHDRARHAPSNPSTERHRVRCRALVPVRPVRARRHRPPRLPRPRGALCAVGGTTAAGLLAALSPDFARGAAGAAGRCAPQDRVRRVRLARRLRQGARATWCARRSAAGRCRWCWWCTRTAASTRTSRTSRAGWRSTASSPSRPTRCSRSAAIRATRTRRATLFAKLDQAKTREDFVAAADLRAQRRRRQRQARRGRLLLRRRHGQLPRHAPARTRAPACRSTAAPPPLDQVGRDQGRAADRLCRQRRAHQRGLAGLRGRAEGRRREVRGLHLPRHAARLQQRHHAALRRRPRHSRPGAARWRCSSARCAEGTRAGWRHRPRCRSLCASDRRAACDRRS